MPILLMLANGLAAAFSILVKHPFVLKMMIFTVFITILTRAVIYLQDLVTPYIVQSSLLSVGAYFGILDGISLYLTIILAGFGVKQILAFIRS